MERKKIFGAFVALLTVVLVALFLWDLRGRFTNLEGRLDGMVAPGSGGLSADDESLRKEVRELTLKVERLGSIRSSGITSAVADLPADLRANVEQLASQVAELRRGLDALELQVAAIGSVPQNFSAAASPGPQPGEMKSKEKRVNPGKQIKTRHEEEIRSEQWAARMETAVQAEFANNPAVAGVQIGGLDCRTTLCRLTWQFPEGLSNENAFILENEFMFALGRAGLNSGRPIRGTTGSKEGIFWHQEAPARDQK